MFKKTLACLLIPTFITIGNTNSANALINEENKINNYEFMKQHLAYETDYQKDTLQAKFNRDKKAKELIQEQVNKRIDAIIERKEKEEQERIEKENSYNIDFVLTYYSRHPSENGGHNCTASGSPLREGIVANNYYPFGTKIELEDDRIFVVEDRGGSKHFNNWTRLDVFIDTYDQNYVRSLGTTKIKGKIIK